MQGLALGILPRKRKFWFVPKNLTYNFGYSELCSYDPNVPVFLKVRPEVYTFQNLLLRSAPGYLTSKFWYYTCRFLDPLWCRWRCWCQTKFLVKDQNLKRFYWADDLCKGSVICTGFRVGKATWTWRRLECRGIPVWNFEVGTSNGSFAGNSEKI